MESLEEDSIETVSYHRKNKNPESNQEIVMNYPMRSDLKVGKKFPDFELPDHKGEMKKLSGIIRKFPGVLVFSRGAF